MTERGVCKDYFCSKLGFSEVRLPITRVMQHVSLSGLRVSALTNIPESLTVSQQCSGTLNGQPPFIAGATFHSKDSTSGASLMVNMRQRARECRRRRRVVLKEGELNVVSAHVSKKRRRFLADIVTTMVDMKWRWTLLIFSLSFLLSWLGFAIIWWVILILHGDLDMLTTSANTSLTETLNNSTVEDTSSPLPQRQPCVHNVQSFLGVFLFSIETQHTIGYGARYVSAECLEALFLLCAQSITGLIVQALMVSIVFTKLARPTKRAHTLLFSRNAVVCQRDGRLCLMFRVGNLQSSLLIDAHVRAFIIQRVTFPEGEVLPFHMQELDLGHDVGGHSILFIWPLTMVHVIDPKSPLYALSADDLKHGRFEIVVMLEGSTESTAMTTQARSSYIPAEILWGHRFHPVIKFRRDTGQYCVDFGFFHKTTPVDTPLCSAAELDQVNSGVSDFGAETFGQC